jgi:dolichol-phosphate mannosyltransferase
LVLGSRYVDGGGVSNWSMLRRIVSRVGSGYARLVLRVPVRDLTGGFKCIHRRVLEGLDLGKVDANGYAFQIELTYWAAKAGFSIKEIPIVFRAREKGKSKMTPDIALEAVWKVPSLRFRS